MGYLGIGRLAAMPVVHEYLRGELGCDRRGPFRKRLINRLQVLVRCRTLGPILHKTRGTNQWPKAQRL